MPATTAEVVSLLDLEEIEVGLFRGRQPETVLQRTFGGQVLAQSLMAAYRTVPADRICHSLNAYFLRGGRTESPIIYDVETTRDGGSFSSRRVLARQGGQVIFTLSASFHVREDGLTHSDPVPEGVPAPEDCPKLSEVMTTRFGVDLPFWHEWDAIDARLAGDSLTDPNLGAHETAAAMRLWVKTADSLPDDIRLHQAVAAYFSDITLLGVSTVPHKVAFMSPQVQAASIDHAMWFHRDFRADEWMLYDQTSPSASHALGFSQGQLMQNGLLVASCSQVGLVRILDS